MNPNFPTDETLSEGGPVPPMPSAPPPAEDAVSLSALAIPGDGERMESPSVGDKVAYQVEGTISRIEGDRAFVTKSAVNGQPCEPDADNAGGAPDQDADDLGKLESDAAAMSQGGY